jgi:hypothetical protein
MREIHTNRKCLVLKARQASRQLATPIFVLSGELNEPSHLPNKQSLNPGCTEHCNRLVQSCHPLKLRNSNN